MHTIESPKAVWARVDLPRDIIKVHACTTRVCMYDSYVPFVRDNT